MSAKSNGIDPIYTLNCKGKLIELNEPRVMGILNVTEDSFYPGSRVTQHDALALGARMLEEGATFLDIGGQSSRPGSALLNADAEAEKVVPVIEALISQFPDALLSVDTFHASVARAAVQAGASLVNDISAGQLDPEMIPTVAALGVPFIAMHMKGTPKTMQAEAHYHDITREVLDYLALAAHKGAQAGIHDIIIDPGFGFAKTIAHNYTLLGQLQLLKLIGRPILVGLSRKSMIYKTLGKTSSEALNGSTALHSIALLKGANILRVHDVGPCMEVIRLVQAMGAAAIA